MRLHFMCFECNLILGIFLNSPKGNQRHSWLILTKSFLSFGWIYALGCMGHAQSSQSLPVPVLIWKGWKSYQHALLALYWNRKIWKNTKPHGKFSWLDFVQLTWLLISPHPKHNVMIFRLINFYRSLAQCMQGHLQAFTSAVCQGRCS